ncbi:ExbD/TolR family protein [Leptolyngbya sp. AN02str]|uniref:ExbD/TolR family protein n=1 Tax=Leptolyngbya sp. AN02str TaxID=3423363 RepID=UPI003D31C4B4
MKVRTPINSEDVRIELLPLIDVVFCILTFFILAAVTLTRQSGINVDLPRAQSGVTQMREMLIVSVDPVGQVFIEKEPVLEEQLRQELVNFRTVNPDGVMVLYASRLASYNDVVRVLDTLRSVGGDRVALATLPESGALEALPSPTFDLNDPNSLTPGPDGLLTPNPQSLPGFDQPTGNPRSVPVQPLPGSGANSPSGNSPSGLTTPNGSNQPSGATDAGDI